MPKITWLHLTDLHRGMLEQASLWPNIEKPFFEDLRWLNQSCGPWDFVMFSGDLVQKGDPKEFLKLNETLKRLYEHLNSLGSDPVLLVVPGNHDLKRPVSSDAGLQNLQRFHEDRSVSDEFWDDPGSPLRQSVKNAFSHFMKWQKNHQFVKPPKVKQGMLPGDFSATIAKGDIKVGIVGLNSAFLQLKDGDFKGKMALSTHQLISVCGEHFTDWFDQHTVCFLMTHHPPSWLANNSREALRDDIALPGRFVAQVCGHLHEALHETTFAGGDPEARRCWQGRALFGLEFYGDDKQYERHHGYSAGMLEINDEGASVRVWPRQAIKLQSGKWRFHEDRSATLESDFGTARETVTARYERAQTVSGEAPKYEVLLLATDSDLGNARKIVAEHLRRSLGVTVSETPHPKDRQYDLVILMQAWRWDGGNCAQAWEKYDSPKAAFIVDEDADWPPRKLVELDADNELKLFRTSVADRFFFKNPEQLPELVGKTVTKFMHAQSGDLDIGLREWERLYLESRLPAWRSGRTAKSRPHLFDAEQLDELYEPDLYVPMHGTSLEWEEGSDGYPRKKKKTGRQRNKEPLSTVEGKRRVSLAKWVGVLQMPRLALVGAPGGGKTIFLTRIAAALAHSCLGRNLDFEPELNVERLRHNSRLPIPIVLEATRVASQGQPATNEALLKAIIEETSCVAIGSPEMPEIEAALKDGRFLLLIDALDEIAENKALTQLLALLKSVAVTYPKTKLVLTTRSARYTGDLTFAPELHTVEVAPLDREQIRDLCRNWSIFRKHDDDYTLDLLSAASDLAEKVGGTGEDQAITENPLMLTAICMVFERYQTLPDDRGRLCELLIEDLCRSRRSEDLSQNWKLDETSKKDLLQRIALAMQEEGAQSWPVEKAIQIAQQLVPTSDSQRNLRAKKYLDWAADHTGILRFQEVSGGGEQIRFWHRIFREYLAACRIAQLDTTASQKIKKLWDEKRLSHPFWEDVIRLLPRTLGTFEKAKSVRETLEKLASKSKADRGRLLALAAAGIIENRDLFPDVLFSKMASQMARTYESEGLNWRLLDRILFLEALGRLDPAQGDPRLRIESWVALETAKPQRKATTGQESGALAERLVTVQEFIEFIESPELLDDALWIDMSPSVMNVRKQLRVRIMRQERHPNWPVVEVGVGDAIAYCRWRSRLRTDGKIVRLPTSSDWQKVLKSRTLRFPWGKAELKTGEDAQINWFGAALRHPSPVGAFPPHASGLLDLIGNVWEWGLETRVASRERRRRFVVIGFSFQMDVPKWHPKGTLWTAPPPEFEIFGHSSIGFRCLLTDYDLKISSVDFSRMHESDTKG